MHLKGEKEEEGKILLIRANNLDINSTRVIAKNIEY